MKIKKIISFCSTVSRKPTRSLQNKMSKNNTMVFTEMRPPVAAHHGETPLRGKHVNKLIEMANGEIIDSQGFRVSKEQVIKSYTDDARLVDTNWNKRHHVTPSNFNDKNHKYYKVSAL
jgi:hypothetical protein